MQGTAIDKVNRMVGVKDMHTHPDNKRTQFVARCIEDTPRLGDIMPVGFGDGMRRWNDHGPGWVGKEGKRDKFISTLTHMLVDIRLSRGR